MARPAPSGPAGPKLFVSYAHADFAYTEELCAHLADHGLPVWSDWQLELGDDFVVDIQRIVQQSCGVIVVMSPASAESRFVRVETLEGWVHDCIFLPILLSGDVHFLLRSTQYFDARGGALPGEREIRRMRALCGSGGRPVAYPPNPPVPLRPAHPPPPAPTDRTPDRPPTWPAELAELLGERKFGPADFLTTSLILESAERLDDGWLRPQDGNRIPLTLLTDIDRLWRDNSNGRFGFTRQRQIRSRTPAGAPIGGGQHFFALAESLGWRLNDADVIPRYGQFVASDRYPHGLPDGFFPTLRNAQIEENMGWLFQWRQSVMATYLRFLDAGGNS